MGQVAGYRIDKELGRSATAVVYKAFDPRNSRTVAVKTVTLSAFNDTEEREEVREELLRASRSARSLNHPNIATTYDIVDERNVVHVVMEFVDGDSLRELLAARRVPRGAKLVGYLKQVASALDYAHAQGLIHCDLKPSNIFLKNTELGGDRTAKIATFGAPGFVSGATTRSGTKVGTPDYMSPEQIQGITLDPPSDQFAFAAITYELLCGKRPFVGDNVAALFFQICRQEPKPVEELNTTLNSTVSRVILRALAKSPNERFESCKEYVEALSRALAGSGNWAPLPSSPDIEIPEPAPAPAPSPSPALPRPPARASAPSPSTVRPLPPPLLPPLPPRPRRSDPDPEGGLFRKFIIFLALCLALGAGIVAARRFNLGRAVPAVSGSETHGQTSKQDPQQPGSNSSPARTPKNTPTRDGQNGTPGSDIGDRSHVDRNKENQPTDEEHTAPKREDKSDDEDRPTSPSKPIDAPRTFEVELSTEPKGARMVFEDIHQQLTCPPKCKINLSKGPHTVTAYLTGYEVTPHTFSVPEQLVVAVTLPRKLAKVTILFPEGASVSIDGRIYKKSPASFDLNPGDYSVDCEYGDGQRQTEKLSVTLDRTNLLEFPNQ